MHELGSFPSGTPRRQAAPRKSRKLPRMIRVRVPLDLHAVAGTGSAAFAFATPLRVGDLIAMAVRESIGKRAPIEKFERSIRRTMVGLACGEFWVDIDGRRFCDPLAVVLCEGIASVRFFTAQHTATL